MKHRKNLFRGLASVLLASLVLTGCDLDELASEEIKAGETISDSSKWINSALDGAIDENTVVNLKDDFHTAVNREWFLNTELTDGEQEISSFTVAEKLLTERKKEIIFGDSVENKLGILTDEQLAHNEELIKTFAELSGDWEKRDELGIEPVRPYVEAIENIQTMEEMSDYILNRDQMNYTLLSPFSVDLTRTKASPDTYTVSLQPNITYTLQEVDSYLKMPVEGLIFKARSDVQVEYILERLGYSKNEIKKIIKDCYKYEGRLIDIMAKSAAGLVDDEEYLCTYEELLAEETTFPLKEYLDYYELGDMETYHVLIPDYTKNVQKIYNEKYLQEMKAFFIVHTVNELLPLLDSDSFEKSIEIAKQLVIEEEETDESTPTGQNNQLPEDESSEDSTENKEKDDIILMDVIDYLQGPLDQLYVSEYCTKQQKEDVSRIIDAALDYYSVMLMDADWLSMEAREAAVEKLNYITIRAVYPDEFVNYEELEFDGYDTEGATLVDAVAATKEFSAKNHFAEAGNEVDRSFWDLEEYSTTICNAYYMPGENSVNILAGILLGGFYEEDMTQEEKLGRIGCIVAHEITHAFDTTGCYFDKNGHMENWWSLKDLEKFGIRSYDLTKYYNAIIPYPGAALYNGSMVCGEAIADMGSVKCMLGVAEKIPDFDYERFFVSYSKNWCSKLTLDAMKSRAAGDEHPLDFLRTNVTLQQFEKFYETFDIQPGDGMYLEPEKRISVW